MIFIAFYLAFISAIVATVALFFKSEAIRGTGRVFDGISRLCFGFVFVGVATIEPGSSLLPIAIPAWLLVLCGLLTIGAGVRKFARRKVAA